MDAEELLRADAPFVADTSAWWRAATLPNELGSLLQRAVLDDPLLDHAHRAYGNPYSARTGAEYAELELELDALRILRNDRAVADAATSALRELAERADGDHRVPPTDARRLLAAPFAHERFGAGQAGERPADRRVVVERPREQVGGALVVADGRGDHALVVLGGRAQLGRVDAVRDRALLLGRVARIRQASQADQHMGARSEVLTSNQPRCCPRNASVPRSTNSSARSKTPAQAAAQAAFSQQPADTGLTSRGVQEWTAGRLCKRRGRGWRPGRCAGAV